MHEPVHSLTVRQREVIQGFADGLTVKQIARRLGLSPETVKKHSKAACGALGSGIRQARAVALAVASGVVEVRP
jgi:two-component system, NarL family, response regulator DevR